MFYKLSDDGTTPIRTEHITTMMSIGERRVAFTPFPGGIHVSTVFLCVSHGEDREGRPLLWETMVFGYGPLEGITRRCAGKREVAQKMHDRVVEYVKTSRKHPQQREVDETSKEEEHRKLSI